MLTPEERRLRAKLAAHAMHSKHDPRVTTTNGRQAFRASFEAQVDPEGILDPEERQRRAEHARKAFFAKLAFLSARSRRERKESAGHAA